MSLINQVLNDLEKRGASTNIGEATVRVVAVRKSYAIFWWIFSLLLFALLLVMAWHKWGNEIQLFQDTPGVIAATPAAAGVQPSSGVAAEAVSEMTAAASAVDANLPAASQVAATSEKQQAAEKPLVVLAPVVSAVHPAPVIATAAVQAITISGNGFAKKAALILRTPKRNTYKRHQIVMQNDGQFIFNVDFSNKPGTWSVEVVNPSGHSSGQFTFVVQALPPVASSKAQEQVAAIPEPKNIQEPVKAAPLAISRNGIRKQLTQVTPQQQAENEYRKAYALLQQGQTTAALSGFEAALQLDAGHTASRQALVRLLLENKRHADAERVLQEGLQHDPRQSALALLLARMQVGRNELAEALETMEKSLPYAAKQADYQAFVAALLQRQNRHQEAIGFFQKALQLNPQSGVWLMGLGISLHAEQRNSEARDAFNRALETRNLSNELQAFVTQQLKEL